MAVTIAITVHEVDVALIQKYYEVERREHKSDKRNTTLFFMLQGLKGINNLRKRLAA